MYHKHLALFAGLERLGGTAPVNEISQATGLSNRDINNSLRRVEPEYIEVVGTLPSYEWDGGGSEPKILSLTDAGCEEGEEYSIPMADDQISEMWDAIHNLYERVTHLEDANTQLVKENRKLKRYILE